MGRRPNRNRKLGPPDSTAVGYSLVSQALHSLAAESVLRADKIDAEPFATVLLSAVWLEAYVNQLMSTVGLREESVPPGILALREAAKEKDSNHIDGKISRFFEYLLDGPEREAALRQTDQLRKDVRLLFDLRNALGHLEPVIIRGYLNDADSRPITYDDPWKVSDRLAEATMTAEERAHRGSSVFGGSWTSYLYRKETAEWALRTAEEIALVLANCFPEGRWRRLALQQNPTTDEFRMGLGGC
jgi:hypothetical protein